MTVTILRLGHRPERDFRVSTHVGLVARAFGADAIVYSGAFDPKMLGSVQSVASEWGGPFKVDYEANWKRFLKKFKGTKVQLTMYGLPLHSKIGEIKKAKNLLVIVGGEKVPGEVYSLVNHNIAVTNQPHSEIAALAVFLHELADRKWKESFEKAKKKIKPQAAGKVVVKNVKR